MNSSRLAPACALLIAPAAAFAAQLILVGMPPAETTLERIRLAPDSWSAAHVLIAIALGGWIMAGVVLLRRTGLAVAAFAVLIVGVVAAAMTNGIDAVLGVLAGVNADGTIHRAIAEQLVQPLDLWDAALTLGLVALVASLHARRSVPWWGTGAALIGLAVPAFNDLRAIAAAAVLVGFGLLALSLTLTTRQGQALHGRAPLIATVAVGVAYAPAAFLSAERALVLVVVVAILALGAVQQRRVVGVAQA